ncbi:sulfite exporter TauE/SafE family protein [Peribacillus deserti]|uniref:Probable membrane transporter protein n=1 Tax=Peribacillus deserti TaxID=673318 RepID=A0A2N5M0Y1_9BACI|nr:sulfite exporter TauE/SafE family protein [Peribacillus deserti]PLT28019.1 sulfite exporter TauE/SafE family protein [Peribacillus deserti]
MTLILIIIIGFCTTFIGTLTGGGGLIGMPSMLLVGLPIHSVIATAKFSNVFSSFSSFYVLLKQRELTMKEVRKLIPVPLIGGISGGLLANSFSDTTMNLIAVFLLSFAFILNFVKKPSASEGSHWKLNKKIFPALYGISVYDGMFGPGQGTLLMYTFLHTGASYVKALALTRFQTFISCFAAFTSYFFAGHFMWEQALCYTAGGILGAQLAVRLAKRISPAYLKMLLHAVTLLLILQILYRLISGQI